MFARGSDSVPVSPPAGRPGSAVGVQVACGCPVTACFPLQCGTVDQGLYMNLTERSLQDAQRFILMHEVVQPVSSVPAFMEDDSQFSHMAVDVVQGRDMLVHVIYLATGRDSLLSAEFPTVF